MLFIAFQTSNRFVFSRRNSFLCYPWHLLLVFLEAAQLVVGFKSSLFFENENSNVNVPVSVTRDALVVFLVVPNFDYISLSINKT